MSEKIIRITPENVDQYIGKKIFYISRGKITSSIILGVSTSKKTVQIENPDLKNNLEIIKRKVYIYPEQTYF
jgi:adenylyl- and sulfurtransferase ThiI